MSTRSAAPEPPRGEWWSDEPEMDNYRHLMQMLALIATIRWLWRGRTDYFVGGNLTVFFSPEQKKSEHFRGPDFFVALDVDGARERRSWVVWEEGGRYPDVIIELLSDSTADVDRGEKFGIYEQIFRTPEYFLFDPETGELDGFRIVGGRYKPIEPDARGRLASERLGLLLGVIDRELRLFTLDGALVAKPEEAAEAAELHLAEAERQVHEAERQVHEAERQAHETERRAEDAELRAQRAEAELARLRGELKGGGQGT